MRRGMLLTEAAMVFVGFAAVAVIAAGVVGEHRDARRTERRAAALETAQNLLARLRRDPAAPAPAGWTVERRALGGGTIEVRVRGAGVSLATLLREGER